MSHRLIGTLAALALLALAATVHAYDPTQTFMQGSIVVSPEAGYGHQFDLEGKSGFTDLDFVNMGVRIGWLPFSPGGPGPLYGSLEVGLEPLYQRYLDPVDAFFAGLGLTARYHFLGAGRLVPFLDLAAFAGGTDLKIKEIRSEFTFLLWGGAGLSYFVTDRAAVYGGYRFQHVSNGNTERPNRGFEAHTGVLGVSLFFE
ncbi:MAG TPA: acyloxyacyl hydrolase [Methylomirabilota bacterium]|nr:acyloxyacyl hydrolase [Methylomirabilota bacterium]